MTDLGLFVTTCIFFANSMIYLLNFMFYIFVLCFFCKQLMSKLAFTCYILLLIKLAMTNLS